ncbi:MAG: DUF4249 domain-containing protein [Bacteroidia bacterium]|nr:DUF4249 domain-containing protein [Bacteroidia bacterium]MDW8088327.1 DUF4249 domain-containing protein [Bacteroidia bacterium]
MRRLIPLVAVLGLSGCLKVIDVDVPADTGELVVEGYYSDRDTAMVKVSRTVPYFGESAPRPISDALVILEEIETGAQDTLRWRDTAYFRIGGRVRPVAGHTYRLLVRAQDEEVKAISRLPRRVPIDTLIILYRPAIGRLPEGYRAFGFARDPDGENNAYRARVWRNDTLFNRPVDWIYSDDRYIDGRLIVFEFPYPLNSGDKFTLELRTIPTEVVRYYDQVIRNAFGGSGGFAPPPDNAYSNFQGGKRRVWGYFMAYASDIKSAVAP